MNIITYYYRILNNGNGTRIAGDLPDFDEQFKIVRLGSVEIFLVGVRFDV